jgi:hypothetical protein
MDALTLVAEIIKAVAWPLAALGLALLFRKPAIGLVSGLKLRGIKSKAVELEFSQGIEELKMNLPAAPPAATATQDAAAKLDVSVAASPVEAILRAWNDVEGLLVASVAQGLVPSGFVMPDVLQNLVEKGIIRQSTCDSVVGLYHLRNLAAHAPDERIPPLKAREFVTMAGAAKWAMEQDFKKHQSNGSAQRHPTDAGPGK